MTGAIHAGLKLGAADEPPQERVVERSLQERLRYDGRKGDDGRRRTGAGYAVPNLDVAGREAGEPMHQKALGPWRPLSADSHLGPRFDS